MSSQTARWVRHDLCADPIIYWIDGFASDAECHHIRDLAACNLEPALVEADGYGARRPSVRTCSSCWLASRGDKILESLEDRICDALGCVEEATEFFHVVCYRAGSQEQYKPHLDAYDLSTPRGQRATVRGGQRVITALLYLSTIGAEDGGCTLFTELGLRCSSTSGRLLVFHNCSAGSTDADPRLRHAGEPVVSGTEDKWVCNKWVRELPLRARRQSMMSHLYGQPASATSASALSSRDDTDVTCNEPHTSIGGPTFVQPVRRDCTRPCRHHESCDCTVAGGPDSSLRAVRSCQCQTSHDDPSLESVSDECMDRQRCNSNGPTAAPSSQLLAAARAWKRQRVGKASTDWH